MCSLQRQRRRLGDPPSTSVLAGATLVAAVALALALTEYIDAFRALNNRAAHNASQSERDRSLEIARTLGIDIRFVDEALRLPADATYVVATGPAAPAKTPLAYSALAGYLENLLLPRTISRDDAEWLLCYGCELPSGGFDVAWRSGGMVVARLRR